MTCIVGLVKDKKVYIGGDSAGVNSESLETRERFDSKIFKNGPFIIGYTSSFRMGQLLRFKLNVPEQTSNQEDYQYMCTSFIDSVRNVLKEGGFTNYEKGQEEIGSFLVGYSGHLYVIHGDLQVGEHMDKFDAVGCGSKYALGSLNILTNSSKKLLPEKIVTKALETSVKFSGGVRPPFVIINN